ncbi:NADH:ubiquinone reductase (Na(+)-transporting) subunit F [Accumulibacter sp.]|uniref:NADH:ubiquinone reductase (Na(+)-transporting) subunit F n=1 Tax=Accumulibacter sp. TaxID=2053492 RepID=UPI0025E72249|nr:NADH:ubiquinone reductase (Na(+)-transporting) subunit F [Accumulibacter sp.]MCP5228627.1 NADH:ubiquinone reductase (Na(+)-transporting) subunit F [Accumulibacter sp.]
MLAEIALAITVFTGTVLLLVAVILLARQRLVPSGDVRLEINGQRSLLVPVGGKLLQTLASQNLFLSSACGGGGTCAQCKCLVEAGGGDMTPTERGHFTRRQEREGWRLSCQLPVRQDMSIRVPESVFGVRRWDCRVVANDNVATFIKELTLAMPDGEAMRFRAGSYMQLECPAHEQRYADIDVAPEYRDDWDRLNLWRHVSRVGESTIRAYSMANYPEEKGLIKFNIRIATPPAGSDDIPPGRMSSWVFGRKPGDRVTLYGPFGEFHARETDAEMIYIGGGAGMAPLRSHIFDLLKRRGSKRRIGFWYGARSLREAFYVDEFEQLSRDNSNFTWHLALSDPLPEDHWQGRTGFIHQVLLDDYLNDHPAPEDCEYYLCGPPMMNSAVIRMLTDLGVARESILLDDFGG